MKKSILKKQIQEQARRTSQKGTTTSLLKFRLFDPTYGPEGNAKTLSVFQRPDNTLGYSFYGGWQNSGMGFAISNMQLSKSLPSSVKNFNDVTDLEGDITRTLRTGVGSNKIKNVERLNDFASSDKSSFSVEDAIALLQKSGYTVTKN